jgi:hypothetical protein
LSPLYIWLVCLTSFFMLIASNGLVGTFDYVLNNESGDISYNQKKVANGLGGAGILIIVLRVLDKMYYRQKVLPTAVFDWVQQFYFDDAVPQTRPRPQSTSSITSATFTEVRFASTHPLLFLLRGLSLALRYIWSCRAESPRASDASCRCA